MGESRADVEAGNEGEEEEEDIPTVEMNPKNPMSREEQEHKDCGRAVYRSWCAACVEGRGVGGQHRVVNCWRKRKEKERLGS